MTNAEAGTVRSMHKGDPAGQRVATPPGSLDGGGGGGLTELALVCEEIAAAGTPLLLMLVSAAISAEMISEFGTGEQRGTWLPGLASGAVKMVFAITEPDAGSNTLRISTTARKDGPDWVLHGTKYYISEVDE